jgi:ribosomal-protein-alanine N-acetyltransferase
MQTADLDAVLALAEALHEAPHWPRAAYEVALASEVAVRRLALVAEVDGMLAGFAVASLLPPEAELESIAVALSAQRRGVGRALLVELGKNLASLGVSVLQLEVRAGNRRALGFYRSTGWVQCGLRPGYYADPEEDALLLRLGL